MVESQFGFYWAMCTVVLPRYFNAWNADSLSHRWHIILPQSEVIHQGGVLPQWWGNPSDVYFKISYNIRIIQLRNLFVHQ